MFDMWISTPAWQHIVYSHSLLVSLTFSVSLSLSPSLSLFSPSLPLCQPCVTWEGLLVYGPRVHCCANLTPHQEWGLSLLLRSLWLRSCLSWPLAICLIPQPCVLTNIQVLTNTHKHAYTCRHTCISVCLCMSKHTHIDPFHRNFKRCI